MSIESVMPSNQLILCCPLLLLLSIFPSIRVFSSESVLCIRWPKYWSFIFSISHSNEYSGLISFRIDWFDLAVQGALKSLLQYHNLKASVLQCSAFFMVQLVAQTVSICLQCGDLGPIPLSGRSPGEGNGNPLQCSCLENPRDGGAWWAAVCGITQSWT